MTKLEVLRKYFGHKAFRGGQEPLVDCILGGGDCLGVMPTGAGKSVCFQVPALMLGGTTIVISPLISLMQDQVTSLVQNGVEAACINSTMSTAEYFEVCRMAEQGSLKLLYVAPERLETEGFVSLCSRLEIPLVAVDEAHCVSHWGQDFRPAYLSINKFVRSLKKRPILAAFTATATDVVKDDIIRLLGLREPLSLTTGFDRPNLYFEVREPDDKEIELLDILRERSGSTIVYCSTRKNVEKVAEILKRNGISAGGYHAGMSKDERAGIQDDFIYDRLDVIVATNAFGMGIDKSNVSLVVHFNMPKDLESYYQEAGRAGRDGGAARCIMLYGYDDVKLAEFMINAGHDDENISPRERNELLSRDFKRLRVMQSFAKTRGCLREFILNYFGEQTAQNSNGCGNCGNCAAGFDTVDVTVEAQKILSCIYRLKQRNFPLGRTNVVKILLGSEDKKLADWGMTSLSTYGIMRGESSARLREIMDRLEAEGYFEVSGEHRVCVLTPKADEFIKSKQRFIIHISKKIAQKSEKALKKAAIKAYDQHQNPELFERLRELRKKQATALGVPPYVVFSDSALWSMCAILPRDQAEFLMVSGVGTMKAQRYGRVFVAEIAKFLQEDFQDDKTRS
ncbi:MAG: DNA helicase RecQ, partial [Oscillospiraceae bacterium]|nr:DNA helicase RecQ [Oscillospiraceae bacterium]